MGDNEMIPGVVHRYPDIRLTVEENYSRVTCLSANYRGDNDVKSGAVYISPDIYLRAEEKPRKPQLGDRLKKAIQLVIASNRVSYLQMTSSCAL
jgi:hypothetical protein